MSKENKVVFFDFDGTIVDSFMLAIEVWNKLAEKEGLRKIKKSEIENLRGQGTKEILRDFGIPKLKIVRLLAMAREEMKRIEEKPEIFPKMREALEELKRLSYFLCVITTNSKDVVGRVLNQGEVDCIYASGGISKNRLIKKAIQENSFKKENIVYVGDEQRDIKSAKKAGIKSIAVSWGFHEKEVLKKEKPDKIAENPQELVAAIKALIGVDDE